MTKPIIVYTTRTGHSKTLADAMATMLGTKALPIGDTVSRKGFLGYMNAGFQTVTKKATPILDPGADLAGADTVVMVQPIWASGVTPPLRTWIRAHAEELKGKKCGLFTVCKGSDVSALKPVFETEFFPLSAVGGVLEKHDEASKRKTMEAFIASLS